MKDFLPHGEKDEGKEITAEDLRGTVQSPQFQQVKSKLDCRQWYGSEFLLFIEIQRNLRKKKCKFNGLLRIRYHIFFQWPKNIQIETEARAESGRIRN